MLGSAGANRTGTCNTKGARRNTFGRARQLGLACLACKAKRPAPDCRMAKDSKTAPQPTRQALPPGNFEHRQPEGDSRSRLVCRDCGFIQYDNPKVVVGSVAHWGERILLCRRSINPRKGYWTLPAGYLELNETSTEGTLREAREEACAEIEIERLLAVYNIPRLSQVQLIYVARLLSDDVKAGPES